MKPHTPPSTNVTAIGPERRSARRVLIDGALRGRSDRGAEVTVVNASDGGLMLQSASPFVVGARYQFEFTHGDAEPLSIAGAVVHSMRVTTSSGISYLSGMEFVQESDADNSAVARLLALCATLTR
jgi:hypothetical protein